MEELLNKNIFDGKELAKFSPDYTPNNVLLRMQMRRTMVKDTHSHPKFKSNSWQRKTIKRPKDGIKIGKEIAKIRNSFQNINLKNQIMLKNAVKYVDTLKSEHFRHGFNDELDTLAQQEVTYLKNISEMNLALQNDSKFKLINKLNKALKTNTKIKHEKNKQINENTKNDNRNSDIDDGFAFEDILRVECTMIKSSNLSHVKEVTTSLEMKLDELYKNNNSNVDYDNNDNDKESQALDLTSSQKTKGVKEPKTLELTASQKTKDDKEPKALDPNALHIKRDDKEPKAQDLAYDLAASQKTMEKEVSDLRSLLVMLAISPQTKQNENKTNYKNVKNNATEVDTKTVTEAKDQNSQVKQDNVYDFFSVIPMRVEINERQKILLKKCAEKWKIYVSKKKQLAAQQREETLNLFFEKLSKRKSSASETPETPVNKAKLLARDYNRYRHRYQMQKHIIALQKAKLEEQNRIIEELKYNRIIEASKISIDAMREEVRKTYYDMDKQLKPKIKCLTSGLKVEIEEPALILHCLKVPQFLQRMENRAREREEKHAMIRERRQQMEEERIRLKQQDELARAQMDKDEKIKRMNELKDKRKREKIENIRKKQHTERMRALNVMAELHYEKVIKAKYGIRPFRILLEIKKDNIEKAKAHYKFQLKKNVFLNWMWYTEDMWYERNFKAEDFRRKQILRLAFGCLKKNYHNFVIKRQVADDYYDLYITNLVFRKFRIAIEVVKKENDMKFQMAALYHNSNLLFRTFCCWRTLPALNTLKREQEARKARWREKVLQVVPDYSPPED